LGSEEDLLPVNERIRSNPSGRPPLPHLHLNDPFHGTPRVGKVNGEGERLPQLEDAVKAQFDIQANLGADKGSG
jgi:hypothetical protein